MYQKYKQLLDLNISKISFETRIKYDSSLNILLSYRHNNILSISPSSFTLTNTNWYHTRTTRKKLSLFSNPSIYISSSFPYKSVKQYYNFVSFNYQYKFNFPIFNVNFENFNFTLSQDFLNSSFYQSFFYFPLYENMKFIYSPDTNKFYLESLDLYISLLKQQNILFSDNLISSTNSIFKELYLYALKKDTQINLGILFHSSNYNKLKFVLYNDKTKRRLIKLESLLSSSLNSWIDSFPPLFNPHLLWFTFNRNYSQITNFDYIKKISDISLTSY